MAAGIRRDGMAAGRHQRARIQFGADILAGADEVFCDATMQVQTMPPKQRIAEIAFIVPSCGLGLVPIVDTKPEALTSG